MRLQVTRKVRNALYSQSEWDLELISNKLNKKLI